MAVTITHVVPMFRRVGGELVELNPYKVGHCEVRVDFDGVLETRHAHLDRAAKAWSVRNSTAARNVRLAAMEWAESASTAVSSLEKAVRDIEAKVKEMGRKKGVKAMRGELKFAKTRLAETRAALKTAQANLERVRKDHPEFITIQF